MFRIVMLIVISFPLPALSAAGRSEIVYEIFVRSFQDSNGDGTGDLQGVTDRLDYLHDSLGVTSLWLMPIFPSPSYHGYDVTDYESINPDYGTLDTFKHLVEEAHARGMKIVLDIPLNHTSIKHPWFQRGLRDRYVWRDTIPNWTALPNHAKHWHHVGKSFYYSFFSPGLPDLDWTNPQVYRDLAGALKHWVGLGVDGFRLDAARYLVEGPLGESDTAATHALWKKLKREVKSATFVGEVWADQKTINSYHGGGKELDECFAFPLSYKLVSFIKSGDSGGLADALNAMLKPAFFSAPFLTNHDQSRVATSVGGDTRRLALGAAALLTLPGTPYLYYGEELGLPDGRAPEHKGDLAKRTPMPWSSSGPGRGFTTADEPWLPFASDVSVAAQLGDPQSLLSAYRSLIAIRKNEPALSSGKTKLLPTGNRRLIAYARENILVVLNAGDALAAPLRFTFDGTEKPDASVLYGNARASARLENGRVTVEVSRVGAVSAAIVRLSPRKDNDEE